jgi:hypothetical protein
MQRPRRRRLAAALVLGASIVSAFLPATSTAARRDESIPKVWLRAEGQQQRGGVWTSEDVSPSGEEACVGAISDGIPVPPRRGVQLEREPFRGRLVILRDEEPRVRLNAFTELDEDGFIDFSSRQRIRHRVRPVPSRADARRWVVRFRTPAQDDVYLDLFASWRDPSGCGRDSANYVFHLERRPT